MDTGEWIEFDDYETDVNGVTWAKGTGERTADLLVHFDDYELRLEKDDTDDDLRKYYAKTKELKSQADAGEIESSTLNLRLLGIFEGLSDRENIEDEDTRE